MFADRTNWNLVANPLSAALDRHRATGKQLFDLTASNPTNCSFDYDSERILTALHNPQSLHYEPNPKGLEPSRRAVSQYYSGREIPVSPDDIILTASTSEAYSFVFRLLCNPGDELIIPAPSYPLFDFLADLHDVKLARYPLLYDHGWQIDFAVLERAITPRTKGVIVVNPNNPTGHFIKTNEMTSLNQLCSVRNLAIIADEVFLDFTFAKSQPISFAANNAALTFTTSGLSKIAGLPQMKLAWLLASGPAAQKEAALDKLEVIADTYLSPSTPVQLAAPEFLKHRASLQRQLLTRVSNNLSELDRQLAVCRVCSRLEFEGGWYAVLRIPATRSDEQLAVDLLTQKHVYVHPGHFFDFPNDGYLVVSLIAREPDFAEGMRRTLEFF